MKKRHKRRTNRVRYGKPMKQQTQETNRDNLRSKLMNKRVQNNNLIVNVNIVGMVIFCYLLFCCFIALFVGYLNIKR